VASVFDAAKSDEKRTVHSGWQLIDVRVDSDPPGPVLSDDGLDWFQVDGE
jgi:hypothetical protein